MLCSVRLLILRNMVFVYLLVTIQLLASKTSGDTKVWIYTSDIADKRNWESTSTKCDGLIFANLNNADFNIERLEVKRVSLPEFGLFQFLPGFKMVFNENSKDLMNCVTLKPIHRFLWLDESGWNNTDNPDNPAIPYTERLPSGFDDIVIPNVRHANLAFGGITAKSLTVGLGGKQVKLSSTEFYSIYNHKLNYDIFDGMELTNKTCDDVTGCTNDIEHLYLDIFCQTFLRFNSSELNCRDPITPYGFCKVPQCGASITIETFKPGFRLDKIKKKLKEYGSHTHASKILKDPDQIQIFFTENEFTGESILEATEFYNLLRTDDSYFCGNVKLETSGSSQIEQNKYVKNALSVIFGTLIAVIVMFGLLFVFHSPIVSNLNVRNRLLGNRPLSTYILRYDNIEDRGYIIEESSAACSTINLSRSFDNPMYEETYSTTSTSDETIGSIKLEGRQDVGKQQTRVEDVNADLEEAKEMSEADAPKEAEDTRGDILLKDI